MVRLLVGVLLAFPAGAAGQITAIQVPPVAVTSTDVPLALTADVFLAPVVEGGDEEEVSVDVSASYGTVSAGDIGPDTTIALSGTLAEINDALDGLVFTPAAGFAGGDTLTVWAPGLIGSFRVAVNAPMSASAARIAILAGVTTIHGGVQPGYMVAYGEEAAEIAWHEGDPANGPLIAAGTMGAGRVIAVPDHQMLNMGSYGDDSGLFYTNGLAWLAGSSDPSIAIATSSVAVADWLAAQGYLNVTVTGDDLAADLAAAEVFVPPWLGSSVSEATLSTIGTFVRDGGGLFLADYGAGYAWWWGKPFDQAPGNRLLREAGIGFVGGNRWDTGLVDASGVADGQISAADLVAMLEDPSPFSDEERDRAGALFGRIHDALAPDDPLELLLDARFWAAVEQIVPTPTTPVSDAWEQGLLKRELTFLEATPPASVVKHRTADGTYGAIPDEAPRVTRTVTVDPAVTRWHSTGAYAAPGEAILVDVPAGVEALGFQVRTSGHVDDISGRSTWLRMPRVSRTFALDQVGFVELASPFGGALYVDVGTEQQDAPVFDLTFLNVVEAPLFVLDETTDVEWAGGIADLPAPQAEIASEHLSLSVPSGFVREVAQMHDLVTFWDQVVAHHDQLGQHGQLRTNAERINVDVQISVGLLHAGYPTQGPASASAAIGDLGALLENGSWGWFHELGHEAQRRPDKAWGWNNPYTFDGSVEATVNIFTSYAFDQLGIPSRGGWSWTGSRVEVMKRALSGLENGSWADQGVGTRLAMFLQLRDHWGWSEFEPVFASYVDSAAEDLPVGDPEERDQWLIRFSQQVGHDLTPFLKDTWGVAISDDAAAQVADLPDWMPALGGIEGTHTLQPSEAISFDLQGEALSHDGVADVVSVGQGAHGAVTDEGDGVWTWTPEPGFTGVDSFEYTVVSSTGHAAVSTIEIATSDNGVLLERWYGISGIAVSDLTGQASYPDSPGDSQVVSRFESPWYAADQYGIRMRAFLVPQVTGSYILSIATDDNGELWIGTDHTPESKFLIGSVPGHAGQYEWAKYTSQQSPSLTLKAGVALYIEGLAKEHSGGDGLTVGWSLEGGAFEVIPNEALRAWREDNAAPVATPDEAGTVPGEAVKVDVVANDTDADGDVIYLLSADSADGTASLEDGLLVFVPADDFAGSAIVEYVVADGHGGATTGTLTVTVLDPQAPGPFAHLSPPSGDILQTLYPRLCWEGAWGTDGQAVVGYTVALASLTGAVGAFEVEKQPVDGKVCARPTQALVPGTWSWLVTAVDAAGKTTTANSGLVWEITLEPDVTPPSLALTSWPNPGITCEPPAMGGLASDLGSGVLTVDGRISDGPWTAGDLDGDISDWFRTWTWVGGLPDDGPQKAEVRALDAEGNESTWSMPFTTDCGGPEPFFLTGQAPVNDGGTTCGLVTLSWEAAVDVGVGLAELPYEIWIDGAPISPRQSSTAFLADLAEGGHTWSVRAWDSLDQWTEATPPGALGGFGIDCGQPVLADSLSLVLAGEDVLGLATGVVPPEGAEIAVQARGELCFGSDPSCDPAWAPDTVCVGPDDTLETTSDDDGAIVLTAAEEAACGVRGFEVTALIGPGFGAWFPADLAVLDDPTPTFDWRHVEGDVETVRLLIGGEEVATTPSAGAEVTLEDDGALDDGVYVWRLAAADSAGNEVLTPTRELRVDTQPPEPFSLTQPSDDDLLVEASACWSTATDLGSGVVDYLVLIDGELATALPAGETCTDLELEDGDHCVQILARDALRHERLSAEACFTIDSTPPDPTTLVEPSDGACFAGEAALGWIPCEGQALLVDGQEHETELEPEDEGATLSLEEGVHVWAISCHDEVGNLTQSEEWSFTIDETKPEVELKVITVQGEESLWLHSADAGCGVKSVEVALDDLPPIAAVLNKDDVWTGPVPELGVGVHTVVATVEDHAGNIGIGDLEITVEEPEPTPEPEPESEPEQSPEAQPEAEAGPEPTPEPTPQPEPEPELPEAEVIPPASDGGCRAGDAPATPAALILFLLMWMARRRAIGLRRSRSSWRSRRAASR